MAGGFFRWRWRLGNLDNPAQVGNALHALKGLSVPESVDLVIEIQEDLEDPTPGEIWREAKRRIRKAEARRRMLKRRGLEGSDS